MEEDLKLLKELKSSMCKVSYIIKDEESIESIRDYYTRWIVLKTDDEDIYINRDGNKNISGFNVFISYQEGLEECEEEEIFKKMVKSFKKENRKPIEYFKKKGLTFKFEKPVF